LKKWKIVFQKEIRKINPETASSKSTKRKRELKSAIIKVIGSDYEKFQGRTLGNEILLDVVYYLYKSESIVDSTKDLDNLLKILFDVLKINMGKEKGLGLIKEDSQIFEVKCKKVIINNPKKTGLDLKISYR
jgi:Holliday junction resolvase RusA-like endonuclease